MIMDVHSHVFSKAVRTDRSAFFASEPAFRMLYDSPRASMAGAGETLRMMDEQGVDRSVIFGFPWQDADTFRQENDYVLETVAKHPDRFTGFCCFDATQPGAASETERCLDAGMSGVGELAFYETGIDDACRDSLEPVMALCMERNLPVLIHTNEPVGHVYPGKSPNTLEQIYALAARYPDNKIILAHWGGGILFYHLLKREVGDVLKNVWYDTAASPFLYKPEIYKMALKLAGPEKILLGTDYPLLKPERYFTEMRAAGISAAEMAAICGENAQKLFGL